MCGINYTQTITETKFYSAGAKILWQTQKPQKWILHRNFRPEISQTKVLLKGKQLVHL